MELKVYYSGIEYTYNSKSNQFGKLKGGTVYAFVNATDARVALDKILSALNSENLNPIDVEFISLYDIEMEWETQGQTNNFLKLYDESSNSNDVIFDDFYAYESE